MPVKTRITVEEKVEIVETCLRGETSMNASIKRYGIGWNTLYTWIRLYKLRGVAGLQPASTNRKYLAETKYNAVQDYLSGQGSLDDICTCYEISDQHMLRRWIKQYNSYGDFKQPNSGGAIYVAKGRKTTLSERIEIVSHCIADNRDYGKAIEQYGVSYQQIYGWVRKYEKDGVDGLTDRRGNRKEESAMSEVEKLRAQLKLQKAENLRLQMENELLKKLEALERGQTD